MVEPSLKGKLTPMFTQRKEPLRPQDKTHQEAVKRQEESFDYSDAPECKECGEPFNPRRAALGYETCLDCGSPAVTFAVVPVPKSNYTVARSIDQVRSPYSHKGNGQ